MNDLGSNKYLGFPGGLYPGGSNHVPSSHLAAALQIARETKPLDVNGNVDLQRGKIVLMSVGMSNTTREFASGGGNAFKPRADADPSRNPQLVIVDGAQGGQAALQWADPDGEAWATLKKRLESAGVARLQVQVAWLKLADRVRDMPDRTFPAHVLWHRDNLAKVVQLLKSRFPNLKIAYLSSRTRAYSLSGVNPEPFAYETAFAVKWLIEDQINGAAGLNPAASRGAVRAPLLLWGPYLWVDGLKPRSDGLIWECSDTASDGIHPSASGVEKVADQLLAFFKSNPTSTPWFLDAEATSIDESLSNVFYFPVVGDGASEDIQFRTRMIFINTGPDTPVEVSFFNRQGDPLEMPLEREAAGSSLQVDLPKGGSFSAMTPGRAHAEGFLIGYARVKTSPGVSGSAVLIGSDPRTGTILYATTVPASEMLTQFTLFADTENENDTSIAIVNPAPAGRQQVATVRLRFYDTAFRMLADRVVQLNPGEMHARFARGELFTDLEGSIGTVMGKSDTPVVVLGLIQHDEGLPFPLSVPNLYVVPLQPDLPHN